MDDRRLLTDDSVFQTILPYQSTKTTNGKERKSRERRRHARSERRLPRHPGQLVRRNRAAKLGALVMALAKVVMSQAVAARRLVLSASPAVATPMSLATSPGGRAAALLEKLSAKSKEIVTPPGSSSADLRGIGAAGTVVDGQVVDNCGTVEEEVVEMEDMFCETATGLEWGGRRLKKKPHCMCFFALKLLPLITLRGVALKPASSGLRRDSLGPMRGGRWLEPTRFGDWEQKGRCTDF